MSISTLYRCMRSLEAIKNYAIAVDWNASARTLKEGLFERSLSPEISRWSRNSLHQANTRYYRFYDDCQFWSIIFTSSFEDVDGCDVNFSACALSEWVARIPGLFWSPGASALRALAENAIEFKSEQWPVYRPLGKSQLVMGGVGTIKFSPDMLGNRLVTLSCGHNASSGVPALIAPHVWDYHGLEEGDVISGEARWQRIPMDWNKHFPSIRGIPRGCLVIHDPSQIHFVERKKRPVQFHPCTVMEYYAGDALLYDFVYATADTSVRGYRQKLERFFDTYKVSNERYGRYLLPADQSQPLFDAEVDSLSSQESRSHLRLLEERVHLRSFQGHSLDDLVQVLASHCTNDDLQAISRDIPLEPSRWFTREAAARSAAQLLDACLQENKVDGLVDALARFNPALIA